jgi:hypothetical protein
MSLSDGVAPRQAAAVASLRELFAALTAYAEGPELTKHPSWYA